MRLFRTISHLDRAASSSHFDDAMIRNRSTRMTVAQLAERMDARHKAIDGRFKTIDGRFKAVDGRFRAVDKRFDAVDKRFDRLTARMDAGFSSLHDKLNAILKILDEKYRHHENVLMEHDRPLSDLERSRPS